MYVCMYVCMYIRLYVCMYVCMYIRMYTNREEEMKWVRRRPCTHTQTHTHTHTHTHTFENVGPDKSPHTTRSLLEPPPGVGLVLVLV